MSFIRELEQQVDQAMQADRHRLRNQLRGIVRLEQEGKRVDERVDKLLAELERSAALRARRQQLVPRLAYDPELPVVARKDEIAAAIAAHQVVVVSGETGSGKSTQLPKICLELGRGVAGLIGHTQPRRIAARSIAARLAEELGTAVGALVGYKIRFSDQTSPDTLIKVMTDGVLLAESQHDRWFDQYDTLIIDEAHERSLNIDFLLGYLHRLLPQRPDLKVIITSATIDAQRFAEHFARRAGAAAPPTFAPATGGTQANAGAPVMEVTGRTYPVEVRYRPLQPAEDTGEVDPIRGVADAVDELAAEGPGHILVFLPTERDILACHQKLRGRKLPGGAVEILPLYARLSTAEQNRVFQPHQGRRIVLATNVAESSLTVPGIRYVVDTGTARISRYSPRSKVQRLPVEAVSQASADQRKGRCGRIGPGICIRLYDEDDFLARDRFTTPEIQRTNLAAAILQTLSLELGPLDQFPLLDPPRPDAIRDGYHTLHELGAIDERQQLTPRGRQLARLPTDPRIGRMILAAAEEQCLPEMLIIASALEVQDPRERPADQQGAADAAHARFAHGESDFLSYLKIWDFYHGLKADLSRNQLKKACRQNFLADVRMREWQDVHRQLLEMVVQAGHKVRPHAPRGKPVASRGPGAAEEERHPRYDALHRALLAGLLSNIALRGDNHEYTGAGNQKFFLWPGSGVFADKPPWIVSAELVETTRRYARTLARINPRWIEPLAEHLVKRTYRDPFWDAQAGSAIAFERVTLFGLPVVPRRRVRFGPIDPKTSRDLLIRQGLVAGDIRVKRRFWEHNRQLLAEIERLRSQTRRRDLVVDDHTLYDFYYERIPAGVYDVATLERWLRETERSQQRVLFMNAADLVPPEAASAVAPEEFPPFIELRTARLPLSYRFEPGAVDDGVTAELPREALGQLSAERLDWLVPGLLEEKIEALIRGLPKDLRRNLVPVPEVTQRALREVTFGRGSLLETLAKTLGRIGSLALAPSSFDISKLPPHLRMNVRVLDDRGQMLAQGRDLAELRAKLGVAAQATPPEAESPWHRDNVQQWDFGPLPAEVAINRGGLVLTKHPALVDVHKTAALRLFDTPAEAAEALRGGVRRLLELVEQRELAAQVAWLPHLDRMRVLATPLARPRELEEHLTDLIANRALELCVSELPRNADDFSLFRREFRRNIVPAVQETTKFLLPLFEAFHEIRLALEQKRPAAWEPAAADIQEQLQHLLGEAFLARTPWDWLQHYPRYLRGILSRWKKLPGGVPRDRQNQALVAPHWEAYRERRQAHEKQGLRDPELERFRWMVEEYRVSLFAQELGASLPISPQRLDKQWAKTQAV